MIVAARSSSVSLGRHVGDERRRLVSPLRAADVLPSDATPCASTAFPFDRWQTGRNPSHAVNAARRGVACGASLPLPKCMRTDADRTFRSASPLCLRVEVGAAGKASHVSRQEVHHG